MSSNPILNYLPTGWTEETYKNATDQDFEALTEEIMERRAAETHIETVKWLDEKNDKRMARGAAPLPHPTDIIAGGQDAEAPTNMPDPATENLTNFLNHVEDSKLDLIGLLLDEGIATACGGSADFKRIEEKVFMRIVSDEALEDQRPEGVARAYRTCMEEEDEREGSEDEDDGWGDRIEPGLTTTGSTPFVKPVDATLGMGQRHEYTGTIKVAITSLMPAFYAALLGYDVADVASKGSDDGIWRNIGPWDAELEGRRIREMSALGGT
ncbi:hypothetical protein KC354_g11902 [Hortaea werneckii]|nr:hypothetical protein KC354_g11902 [Hortaea werneckii]